jgi:hypothetical protein
LDFPTGVGTEVVNFGVDLPYDRTLCGARVCTQGYGFGGGPARLRNAHALKLGTQ